MELMTPSLLPDIVIWIATQDKEDNQKLDTHLPQ